MDKISTEEFDRQFDDGQEDVIGNLDLATATKRVNVDFPLWMLEELDNEAKSLGVPRQALIKFMVESQLRERHDHPFSSLTRGTRKREAPNRKNRVKA